MRRSGHAVLVVLTLYALVLLPLSDAHAEERRQLEEWDLEFSSSEEYISQLIGYYHQLALTPEQAAINSQALADLPAPCCSNSSLATCCCPCNLAKSTWGLANYLIVERGYDAKTVRAITIEWVDFLNPAGYAGNACYKGRCNRPFQEDACGGMDERWILTDR